MEGANATASSLLRAHMGTLLEQLRLRVTLSPPAATAAVAAAGPPGASGSGDGGRAKGGAKKGGAKAKGTGAGAGVGRGSSRPSAAPGPPRRELALLQSLGPHAAAAGPASVSALVCALLPLLRPGGGTGRGRKIHEPSATSVLGALAGLWPHLAGHPPAVALGPTWVASLAPLFGQLQWRRGREVLSACLLSLASAGLDGDPEVGGGGGGGGQATLLGMASLAPVLASMNSYAANDLEDAPDYDARLGGDGYGALRGPGEAPAPAPGLGLGLGVDLRRLSRGAAASLLHHCLWDLRSEDLALRAAASSAIGRIIQAWSPSLTPDSWEKEWAKDASGKAASPHPATATDPATSSLLPRLLYSKLAQALRWPDQTVRSEALLLLGTLASSAPATFLDLAAMQGAAAAAFGPTPEEAAARSVAASDPERNLFTNLAHFQVHRRSRALRALAVLVAAGPPGSARGAALQGLLPSSALPSLVLPLAQHGFTEPKTDKESGISEASLGVLAAAARRLPWSKYAALLGRYLALIPKVGREEDRSSEN